MNTSPPGSPWADRTGEYSPDYYAYHGPNATSERLREIFTDRLDPAAPILEVGCSAGRHLAHLQRGGFSDLTGVEVNANALRVMREEYPELARTARIHETRIERVVREFDDRSFAAVFSVETLQHLPPESSWAFAELARVTESLLVTVENEGTPERRAGRDPAVTHVNDEIPLYFRDWGEVFTDLGLRELSVTPGDRHTVRVFERPA